jgi:hypothetical protein
VKCEEQDGVGQALQTKFRAGVGKLLHMMRWSRVETQNAVRDLSRMMKVANVAHVKGLMRVMKYYVATPKRGLVLQPHGVWDGGADYEFELEGWSDADWANETENRRSISGWTIKLNGAPVVIKSGQQPTVALSTTEAEGDSGVSCVQDLLHCMRIIESIGLKVKKPMRLNIDNRGTVDLFNSWSVTGRTRHIAVKICFIRELREAGVLKIVWCPGDKMPSDILTKNLARPLFERHTRTYTGEDEYLRGSANPQEG